MIKGAEYGIALYELAVEDGIENEIEKEFEEVANIFTINQEFINLLSNPRIKTSNRTKMIDDVFRNEIHIYLLSLLKILTEKREVTLIPSLFKEYQKKYYQDKNILSVVAVSAIALNDEQINKILDKLKLKMNQTVLIENKVDPTCIGGIRLEFGGHMIDASIKNRLKKLQYDLKHADYSQAEV